MTMIRIHGYANDDGHTQVSVALDLDHPCRTCDATGRVYSHEWRDWNERYDAAKKDASERGALGQDSSNRWTDPTLRALEEEMERLPTSEEDLCGECEGAKAIPTAQGLELLAFVRRHTGGGA